MARPFKAFERFFECVKFTFVFRLSSQTYFYQSSDGVFLETLFELYFDRVRSIKMGDSLEEQIKEANVSLDSGENCLASLTFIEKYEQYLQGSHFEDPDDSDSDYFPNDMTLREEYNQLKHDSSERIRANKTNRLSTGLPGKHNSFDANNILEAVGDQVKTRKHDVQNGSVESNEFINIEETKEDKDERSGLNGLNKLIEKLEKVRQCGPEGNSIFCTAEELEALQECYGEILDYIQEKSKSFEGSSNPTMTPQEPDQVDENDNGQTNKQEENEDRKLLSEKMESVQKARDRFYEVQHLVQEQIEQLELVERYKMESE